jgi:acyl-CoA synthetase (NDP forming)
VTLTAFLNPRSIAVVGASQKTESVGGRIIGQLVASFDGSIYPINPNYDSILGLPAYPSVAAVNEPVDLVLAAAGSQAIPGVLRESAAAGVRGAVVFSSGFAEVGGEGERLQAEISRLVADTGMRLIGPNCLGYANFRRGLKATFTRIPFEPKDGNIAVVAQSGSMGISTASLLRDDGVGVSFWAATGNELDVSAGEFALELLRSDEDAPDVVAMIVEGVKNADLILAAGRYAAEAGKQVVLLKVGRTERGQRAAISHTAALSGPYAAFAAACEQNGIVLVETPRELVDVSRGFAAGRRPAGNRVVITTSSGGNGVLMADVTEAAGLELPQPSPALRDKLAAVLPSFGSAGNPVDVTGNLINDLGPVAAALEVVGSSDEFDIIVYSGVVRTLPETHREMLLHAHNSTDKPFFTLAHQPDVLTTMVGRGMTCFADPAALIRAAGRVAQATAARRFLDLTDVPAPREPIVTAAPGTLAEADSKQLLANYGIAVPVETLVRDEAEAMLAVERMAKPVVFKIDADWLPHKSDVGGVILGIADKASAAAAFARLSEVAERHRPSADAPYRILIAEQIPPGIELMLGLTRDPVHGAVVTLAAGGVLAEIMAESQVSVVPFNRARAQAMVERLWSGRLISHRRGLTASARQSLVDAIMAVQQLAMSEPSISEVDINPLIATADRMVAVDGLVVVRGKGGQNA